MKRKHNLFCIFMIILLLATFSGCGKEQNQPEKVVPEKQTHITYNVKLYFSDKEAQYLKSEEREISLTDKKLLAQEIVNELIKGPQAKDLTNTIPAETKLLSIKIEDKIAKVDFSKEIKTKHPGGSAGEIMTIYSIVNTLTENLDIDAVQILLEGNVIDSIWGHLETYEPIKEDLNYVVK